MQNAMREQEHDHEVQERDEDRDGGKDQLGDVDLADERCRRAHGVGALGDRRGEPLPHRHPDQEERDEILNLGLQEHSEHDVARRHRDQGVDTTTTR